MTRRSIALVAAFCMFAYNSVGAQYDFSSYTLSADCACNYDTTLQECGCCTETGCQCPRLSETSAQLCVLCGDEQECPSELECAHVNGEGCFVPEPMRKEVFSEAGLYCAGQGGHLPNLKTPQTWSDIRVYAQTHNWDDTWSGARIRDFDWQWAKSGRHALLQGCFTDSLVAHHLPDLVELHDNVTVESCIQQCLERGAVYAGVQLETVAIAGTDIDIAPCCRCGNSTFNDDSDVMYPESPMADCMEPCPSEVATQYPCGNLLQHLLFRIGGEEYAAWDTADEVGSQDMCAQLNTQTSTWIKSVCNTTSNHICEYPAFSNEESCTSANYGWTGEKCVNYFTNNVTWHQAAVRCAEQAGYLLQIESQELQDNITALINGTDALWWIGLTNRLFTWTDGSAVTWMPWKPDEPKLYRTHDMCVELDGNRNFRAKNARCYDDNHIVCQIEYGFTQADYEDYVDFYALNDDSYNSGGQGSNGGSGGGGGGNNNKNNDGGSGSRNDLYIGLGVGAAVVVAVVAVFIAYVIYTRKRHRKTEKLVLNGHSNAGFSGPGLDRDVSYRLRREGTVYERIDDTYERPERSHTEAPGTYADLTHANSREETTPVGGPSPSPETAPELPPLRENGYAGLMRSNTYTKPAVYAGLQNNANTYAGLTTAQSPHGSQPNQDGHPHRDSRVESTQSGQENEVDIDQSAKNATMVKSEINNDVKSDDINRVDGTENLNNNANTDCASDKAEGNHETAIDETSVVVNNNDIVTFYANNDVSDTSENVTSHVEHTTIDDQHSSSASQNSNVDITV